VAVAAADDLPSQTDPRCELATNRSVAGDRSAWGRVTALVVSAALLVLVSQVMRPGPRDWDTTAPTTEVAAEEQLAEVWDAVREPLDEPAWTAEVGEEDAEDDALSLVTSWTELPVEDRDAYWIEAAVIGLSTAGDEAGQIQ
jgi:hypothetical protein